MKCPSCGNPELREHHRFCCNCGSNFAALKSSGTSTVSSSSSEQLTATSEFQNPPEASENKLDTSPDQCPNVSGQTPVTKSVTGAERSSDDEITKEGLPDQKNVNIPSNRGEIQAPQEQGAALIDFPAEPGKFLVSDSNCAATESSNNFPSAPKFANTVEAIEREAGEKILQPETSRGEIVTATAVPTDPQIKDQHEAKAQRKDSESLEDNVEERGRNSKEILIQFSDGEKVNNPKQVEEHGKVQCPKEKKDDDDTLKDNQTTKNIEGTAGAHQNAIPLGKDDKQANQSMVTNSDAVSAPPTNNGHYLVGGSGGGNEATENPNDPNEAGTVDENLGDSKSSDNLTTTSRVQKTTCADEPPKADQYLNGKTTTSQDASITVIFHALLTPTFNVKFNEGDKVFLRGDRPFSWNSGTGQLEMRLLRKVNDHNCLLEGKANFTLGEASRSIAYKYVVVPSSQGNAKGKTVKDLWECLIGFRPLNAGRHVNRCLRIPESSIKANATWHQYDDAVFSQPSFWDSIRSLFPKWKVSDAAEGRRLAMMAMLPKWGEISEKEGTNGHATLNKINNVLHCMSRAEFENGGNFYPRIPDGFSATEVLHGYISLQLNRNIQTQQVHTEDEESQARILVTSAVIVSVAVGHEQAFFGDDELRKLFECLLLHGDTERKKCSGLDALHRHFPKEQSQSSLANYLLQLCIFVIEYRRGIFHWLFAMPLLHFLSDTSKPFSFEELTPEPRSLEDNNWWGTQGLNFKTVRRQVSFSRSSNPVHLFSQLRSMFELDPLFIRTFLLALPLLDIATVLQRDVHIPLHEVAWTITRVVEESLPDEEWDHLDQCLREMNTRIMSDFDRLEDADYYDVMSVAKASAHLLRRLLKEPNSILWERIQILSNIFTLLGSSLVMAKRSASNAEFSPLPKEDEKKVEERIQLFQEALQILRGSLDKHVTLINKTEHERHEELQGWTAMLSLKLEDDELQQLWQEKLRESLKYRMDQLTQGDVIKLFCSLDRQIYHLDISECLKATAYEAADLLLESGTLENQMADLDLATSKMQSTEVVELFSLLLETCWPTDTNERDLSQDKVLEHILTWKPMAQYFKHFDAESVGNACLSDGGLELRVFATSLVEHVALCLRSGEINVSTLRIVNKDRDRFLELFSLLPEVPENVSLKEEVPAGIEASGNQRETAGVDFLLEMRVEELEAFEKERDAVSTFIHMCSLIKSVDIDLQNIKEKLEMVLPSRQILEICHERRHGDEPVVKFFDLTITNKKMIQSLHDIHHSLLFRDFWQMCGQRTADFCEDEPGFDGTLTIDKVQERLWLPSYRKWRGLWERIIKGEISLQEVDEKFHRFSDDPKALDREIKAVVIKFSEEDDIDTVLLGRVGQIKQCHKLKECEDAAATILDFKEAMQLQGDFQLLNDFRDQMNEEFQKRLLGAISDEIFQVARALKSVSRPMIQCLRTVIECKEFILWLREEVKGREEVKTLVDLAMMSADESDIQTDRVSCLHTTALGFAPFIFDLANKHADFEQLMEMCSGVWEEVKRNENLPVKLKDISDHLQWLKGIKDEHAMSSLKLAQAINARGVYSIGKLDNGTSTQLYDKKNVHSVIRLLLLPDKNTGQAREFNLEKLQELQSKLALISGKDSQGQEDIRNFGELLQGVVQLAQAYVNLCEIGDVSHLDWKGEYKCKNVMGKRVLVDIQSKSIEFDHRYKECKEHINSLRKKYHELNFFTIQQLLFLRKELAGLKYSSTMEYLHRLQVYSLLEKVCPGIHQSLLQEVFLDAGILSPDFSHFSDGDTLGDATQIASLSSQDGEDNSADEVQIIEKYESLLRNVEKLSHSEPERLAVAALANNLQSKEADHVLWCLKNMEDSDLVDELFERASGDPRFRKIVDQKTNSDAELLQLSQNYDCDQISVPGSSDDELSLPDEPNLDETKGGTFFSLEEIGVFLSYLAAKKEGSLERRAFPSYLKLGEPNLVLVTKEQIFAAVLNLYKDENVQSLPNSDEVLVCTTETTSEEVELLWRRALVGDRNKLHCLVNGDLLDYDVSQKVVDCLHTLMQVYPHTEKLALVVLCSSENEERAHIIACLEQYKVLMPRYPRPDELRRYIEKQFRAPEQIPGEYHEKHVIWNPAATVNRAANFNVRVVSSDHSGVGKSLVVLRLAQEVAALPNNRLVVKTMEEENEEPPLLRVTIPFHDKHAQIADVVGFFLPHALPSDLPLSRIFHLDRSSAVTPEFETLLFNLLILGELTDDCGRVWRRNSYDLYIVEITNSTSMNSTESTEACRFHELLPQVKCCLPEDTLPSLRKGQRQGEISRPSFDEEELLSDAVQRVWWYLHLFETNPEVIQSFRFNPQRKLMDPAECLETLIRNCGVSNPSWSELRNFVNFLNSQLSDCEESAFCDPSLTADTLQGLKTFVVKFMIIMSEDFAMRSLTDKEGHIFKESLEETAESYEEQEIVPFQLRRRWETSPHPYIFFNPDHATMTFLGFQVDQNGNLLDPKTKEIIKRNIMSRPLRTGLHVQKVDLDNNFESYSKVDKIQLLCSVMAIECGYDPDESYELTGDNVKKILAIHMRFRCNIPVVIMGETGCGKTRLIRYLCGLQTEGEVEERRNMLLMKIHGGTTYKDIERNVLHAETVAVKNERLGKKIDTVLFFDEANTTDALGMIKEIIVDRSCNGRPLSDNLKFVVACNPYRKHTKEMIRKLETAGLGYHIKADEITESLGGIPLRHLVYRVHALPESMRSLVWDFGQLNAEVEELYTRQIVRRFVREGLLQEDENLVIAIAAVLTASQKFMRNKKDECRFVSLRDVKRAMEVMIWFYQHFQDFSSLMEEERRKNEEGSESESDSDSGEYSPDVKETLSDSEDDQCDQEKATATNHNDSRSLRDHLGMVCSLIEVNSTGKREERSTVSESMWERNFRFSSKETASAECKPAEIFDYADTKKREKQPTVSESMFEPDFSSASKETVSAECRPTLEPLQLSSRVNPLEMFHHLESLDVPLVEENVDIDDSIDPITWSLILALGVCYQARLTEREEYREAVANSFRPPCRLPGGAKRIEREICRCQEALMGQLELGPNIACNEALRENVFMMVVCIELRIPLFVVGKPGSSKSLAKTVVADNMLGGRSKHNLFKHFKQIQLVSYQCSPQSTPEGILATFQQCSELQESKNKGKTSNTFASVVVLDEVGLAEDSPKMPLKTLHPLLEDDDQNDEFVIQTEKSFTRVAFIGLSNWALDPAKMNRGIMLCRNEPDEDELEETARGICGSEEDIITHVEPLINPLVSGYKELYDRQKRLEKLKEGKKDEFFGLRDFYSLVKMIVSIAKEEKRRPNRKELERAIKRNFSGLMEVEVDFNPVKILMENIRFPAEYPQVEEEFMKDESVNLIRESLNRKSMMGQGRYLLIMTENFAALPRVKQLLLEKKDEEDPYVIFGSGFPKDQLFSQVCRNINRVKMCMEAGRTVILLNLENLYESLYDALNQYYVFFGGEKYVDLGLGNNRVKCRVHKDFRLIVIAEKDVVYNKFPIPLINRLEKHFLVMSSGLTRPQKEVTRKLNVWVDNFADILQPPHRKKRTFSKGDAFIGYHDDIVPAVVLQVCAELHSDGVFLSDEERKSWEEKVLRTCQERLLQCATPDSVTRLRSSRLRSEAERIWTTYFCEQEHSSLANFLEKVIGERAKVPLRAQISTHSRLLSERDIPTIAKAAQLPPSSVKCASLQQFQTEQQFLNCIGRDFWSTLGGRESLLIVQCDSGEQILDLIACSRHLLIEECKEMENVLHPDATDCSHIVMIVQVPRVAGDCREFVSVQGENWLSIHIDELCPPSEEIPPVEALKDRSVSEIFESAIDKTGNYLSIGQVLTSCVQIAASKIEDDESTLGRATRRIELLLKLLPSRTKAEDLRDNRFEMILAKRLHDLLKVKDQRAPAEGKGWLEEVAKACTVNENGTFKKALWRRFQYVVAPILAEVIAYVDRDGNLELAASKDPWLSNLWLNIFEDSSFATINYGMFMTREEDVDVVRSKVPVLKSGYRGHVFQCRFPFSWILKERIDELYREARNIAANSYETDTECLRRLLDSSNVRQIVSEATSEGGEDSVARYLHDFTQMVYKPKDDAETEIVERAIRAAAKEIRAPRQSTDGKFIMDFALVHVGHSRIQQRIHCLSLLLRAKSEILNDLQNRFSWDEDEMTVDAIALQICLERMEPCGEDLKTSLERKIWCDLVMSVKTPVDEMIGENGTEGKAHVGERTRSMLMQCRSMWQRLSAVRMFIEHVYPSQGEIDLPDVQHILKLWKALGEGTDFTKAESLTNVERVLISCKEDLKARLQDDEPEVYAKFLRCCNAFLMEIITVFCFGDDVRNLDPEVFEILMRYVTATQSAAETREFSPFPEFGADSSPMVRSFLLQQLINSSDKLAKAHLQRFLFEAQGLSSEVPHLLNVCLLAVQCMENSCDSTLAMSASFDLHVHINTVNMLCQRALEILQKDHTSDNEIQVKSLEAIAEARSTLGMAARFMYMSCGSDYEKWRRGDTRGAMENLFKTVQALCASVRFRSPGLFLLKQLVKLYGGRAISTVSQNPELAWIVPVELQRREDTEINLDRFLVYGELYREVRDAIARAILSDDTDELVVSLKALHEVPGQPAGKDIVLLLALYREITLAQRASAEDQHFHQEKCATVVRDVLLSRCSVISPNAQCLVRNLLRNSPQNLEFPFLADRETQSETEKALPEILLHLTTVFRCIGFDELLNPLREIVLTPSEMINSFLPTMPEDNFEETRSAMTEQNGQWYECPKGHRYFVGDCGRPYQQRDCPYCDSSVPIGGLKHRLVSNNRLARREDRSNKGHILGTPKRIVGPERDLSPTIVSLLRFILHSAMLSAAQEQPEVVSQLIKELDVQPQNVGDFLWAHLVNDVGNISASLERSVDEVVLMIHSVLAGIVYRATDRTDGITKWLTKAERREWENYFSTVFLRPVCMNLEERLQNFYTLSVNDKRLGSDPLMREIYEVDDPTPPRLAADIHPGHPTFWKYRTRLTVEHIIRQFQDVRSNKDSCKILGKFLKEEHRLRTVRHLPDILALLRILTDRFHRRINRDETDKFKIREFLKEFSKDKKEIVTKLFESFRTAWDQVRFQISSQGRFTPSQEQCSKPIDMTSTVSVLLPAEAGPGVCCKALLFFLVNTHNEMVETYHGAFGSDERTRAIAKIPFTEVSSSQLVAYDSEKDLLPVMLANCTYTLEVGKETSLQYNWEALQKQIVDKFIRGRPIVEFKLDDFVFHEDDRHMSFVKLREKIPQVSIDGNTRTQILSELKELRNVSELLSTLKMAIGFLSTTGGDPETKVYDYLKNLLLLGDGKSNLRSKKAQQSCCLCHILDLWSTIAEARAKFLFRNRQDPFEEISESFKEEMPRDTIALLSAALKRMEVDLFLRRVIEVISLLLVHEEERNREMGLGEYLSRVFNNSSDLDETPDQVKVMHIVHACELALDVREKDQGRRRSMMS